MDHETNKKQYLVTGMTCAACQGHVERAVKKVPGVSKVSVALLTNSMIVEGTAGCVRWRRQAMELRPWEIRGRKAVR